MEWISIKNRLPPQDGTPFLCYDPKQKTNFEDGCIYVVRYRCASKYLEERYIEAGGEGYHEWEPTYWMPLPKVPDGMD